MIRLALRRRLAATISLVALLTASKASAITLGQVDDFQSGGVANWGGPQMSNIANAGPGGMGDNALEVQPDNRFVFFNEMQWRGDYIAAGVTRISMDVQHSNAFNLELRIAISRAVRPQSQGGGDVYITNYSVSVPNDAQWHHLEFDVTPSDFVPGLLNSSPGPGGAAGALADVAHMRILHRPIDGGGDDFDIKGEFATGSMRIDNVRAEAASAPQDADFDDDGDVDGNDFLIWQRGLGAGTNMTGDADGDGMVNGADLDVWEAQFGGAPIATATAAIPEPGAAAIALAGMGLLALAGASASRVAAGRRVA
jgi:hypothetical protein